MNFNYSTYFKIIIIALVFASSSGCAQLKKRSKKDNLKIVEQFINHYNNSDSQLWALMAKEAQMRDLLPTDQHMKLRFFHQLRDVKKHKRFFGENIKIKQSVTLNPWVAIELYLADRHSTNLVLFQIKAEKIYRIVQLHSYSSYNYEYNQSIKPTSSSDLLKFMSAYEKANSQFNFKKIKALLPPSITFIKMSPCGIRDITMKRKDRLSDLKKWHKEDPNYFQKNDSHLVSPPWLLKKITSGSKDKPEESRSRLVLRKEIQRKMGFTINFIGHKEYIESKDKEYDYNKPEYKTDLLN